MAIYCFMREMQEHFIYTFSSYIYELFKFNA